MSYAYDRVGNPVRVHDRGDPASLADDLVTRTTYSDCVSAASAVLTAGCGLPEDRAQASPFATSRTCPTWVHAPIRVELHSVGTDGETLLRRQQAAPNMCGRGQVETLTLDLATGPDGGVAARAVTRYGYDAWANPTRVVYPAAGNGRHHAITNTYDPATGTAVVASTEYDLTPDQVDRVPRPRHRSPPTQPASAPPRRRSTTPGCRSSPPAPTRTGTPPATATTRWAG